MQAHTLLTMAKSRKNRENADVLKCCSLPQRFAGKLSLVLASANHTPDPPSREYDCRIHIHASGNVMEGDLKSFGDS